MASPNNVHLSHVMSFGDAVFAFAITFMAISIQIPDLSPNLSETEVTAKILQLIPQFEIYLYSFIIIGIFWVKYHLIFNKIRDTQSVMVWLNLLFLFFVTLVSFGTALRLGNDIYVSTFVLYALILTLTSILLSLIWFIAERNSLLIDQNMAKTQKQLNLLQGVIPAFIFAGSIGVAFINLQTAQYVWILIIPAQVLIKRARKG
jgi:uncharacterized membrane protein